MALNLFWIFFKAGLFCFGGGNTMISVFERTLVTEYGYLTATEFADMIAISQITPGPFGINIATYTGAVVGANFAEIIFYSAVTTFAVCLPAFFYVVLIAKFFKEFGSSRAVKAVMGGIRPGIIGLILSAVLLLSRLSLYNIEALLSGNIIGAVDLKAVILCIIAGVLSLKTKINPVAILIGSGIIGVFVF